VAGDFEVADSMAFIWAASAGAQIWHIPSLFGATPVTFTAHIDGQQIDTVTIERVMLPPDWPVEEISSPDLVATYIPPLAPASSPAAAMIVIGGSEGGLSPYTGALLALHGYATLSVAYFGIEPLPDTLTNIPLEYFGNAIAWLQSHPDVDPDRIGMLGVSRGGEATLLVASRYPDIKAAISYVGSGIGIASPGPDQTQPAFTWQGEPVPFSNYWMGEPTAPAEIPVEQINGPVVLIAGDADQLWHASFLSRIAWDRLQEHDHAWPNQLLTYPGAGHGITPPYATMSFRRDDPLHPFGGSPLADQVASVNAWRAVLNTLAWRFAPPDSDPS
jgi:dienelactone hydrolase